jgi:hypothetical protein
MTGSRFGTPFGGGRETGAKWRSSVEQNKKINKQ